MDKKLVVSVLQGQIGVAFAKYNEILRAYVDSSPDYDETNIARLREALGVLSGVTGSVSAVLRMAEEHPKDDPYVLGYYRGIERTANLSVAEMEDAYDRQRETLTWSSTPAPRDLHELGVMMGIWDAWKAAKRGGA